MGRMKAIETLRLVLPYGSDWAVPRIPWEFRSSPTSSATNIATTAWPTGRSNPSGPYRLFFLRGGVGGGVSDT